MKSIRCKEREVSRVSFFISRRSCLEADTAAASRILGCGIRCQGRRPNEGSTDNAASSGNYRCAGDERFTLDKWRPVEPVRTEAVARGTAKMQAAGPEARKMQRCRDVEMQRRREDWSGEEIWTEQRNGQRQGDS